MKNQAKLAIVAFLVAFPTLAILPEEELKRSYGLEIPESRKELINQEMFMVVGILESPSFDPDEYWQLGIGKNISKDHIPDYDITQMRVIHRRGTANPMFIWQACYSATKVEEHGKLCDSLQRFHSDTSYYRSGTSKFVKEILKIINKIGPGIKDKAIIDGSGYFIDFALASDHDGLKYSMQVKVSNQEKGDPLYRIQEIIKKIK